MFIQLENTKKLLIKLKNCCTAISKYNLCGPVLLQGIIDNGELDFVLSHNPVSDKFDIFHTFKLLTFDEFEIEESEIKLFDTRDSAMTTIPIITSSKSLTEFCKIPTPQQPRISHETYYIFPKFMLEVIKKDIIKGFEVQYCNADFSFNFNIQFDNCPYVQNRLFLQNNYYTESIFTSSIFPLFTKGVLNDFNPLQRMLHCISSPSNFPETYFNLENKDEIKSFIDSEQVRDHIVWKDTIGNMISIFHNMFLRVNLSFKRITMSKFHELKNGENYDIATVYNDYLTNNDIHIYFMYKYYELGESMYGK